MLLNRLVLYFPLPGSTADAAAAIFFLGLLALVALQVYQTRPKR